MAMQLHMTIEGDKQGPIDGPSKMKGREKTFEVIQCSHQVSAPFEQRAGTRSGKRQHQPLSVTKYMDEASPKLYRALTQGEHLRVEIKWYRPHPEGGAAEQHYFTTILENAVLTALGPSMAGVDDSGTGHLEHMEFIYQTITWRFEGGGEHIDKWLEPA